MNNTNTNNVPDVPNTDDTIKLELLKAYEQGFIKRCPNCNSFCVITINQLLGRMWCSVCKNNWLEY